MTDLIATAKQPLAKLVGLLITSLKIQNLSCTVGQLSHVTNVNSHSQIPPTPLLTPTLCTVGLFANIQKQMKKEEKRTKLSYS